jgi:beta-galactosidase
VSRQSFWYRLAGALALMAGPLGGAMSDAQAEAGAARPFLTDVFSHHLSYRPQVSLDGQWEFRRDQENQGRAQGWEAGKGSFDQTITLPGAPQAQGIGEPNTRQKHQFLEPFWVRRSFAMPAIAAGQRVWLRIGGIFPAAELFLNGRSVGYTKSSRTQQRVDVTDLVQPGAENLIAIQVCDLPEVRLDGMYEWQELSMIWSGVYRSLALEVTDRVSVIDEYVRPRLAESRADVRFTLSEAPTVPLRALLRVLDGRRVIGKAEVALLSGATEGSAEVKLSRFTTWHPEHPQLYTLELALSADRRAVDRTGVRFGMREIHTTRDRFLLNGKPIYVRCIGDMGLYLDTIAPPADKAWYLPRLKRARAYGMNMAKCCVELFTEEFMEAADEAGILVIQEFPFGVSALRANRYVLDERFREFYARELDGMVRMTRNHASAVAYSMSSEMEFTNQTQASFEFFSQQLPTQTRGLAPHALVIDCTGYLDTEETAKGKRVTDFYASIIPTWLKEVLDETPVNNDGKHPSLLHEFNWWSCYPNPADKPKYRDTQMLPTWLDTLVETARQNGQEELIPTYRRNGLWLQALSRKDGVEYARRCPHVEGFILWAMIDYHQYSEGLLDDFWQPKDVSAREFLKSAGDTVILLAEEGRRSLTAGTRARLALAVSHYGEADQSGSTLRWQVKGGPLSEAGELPVRALPQGQLTRVGKASFALPKSACGYKLELQVSLVHDGQTINTNNWSFWAFPEAGQETHALGAPGSAGQLLDGGTFVRLGTAAGAAIPEGARLVVADSMDAALAQAVAAGADCLLFSHGAAIENPYLYYPGMPNFHKLFRCIPWNSGPGNSGTVITPHPALADFPHEGLCDLQFVWMVREAIPMEFEPLRPYGVTPIIRAIDWYRTNRNNAYLLEFRVGKGRVLVTCLNVLPRLEDHIEARSFVECLLRYVRGAGFQPTASVPGEEFLRLFRPKEEPKGEPNGKASG